MSSWTGLRKQIRELFVKELQKRVDFHYTVYTRRGRGGEELEANSRFWVTVDKEENYSLSAADYYQSLACVVPDQNVTVGEDEDVEYQGGPIYPVDLDRRGEQYGIIGPWDIKEALNEYPKLGIQELQASDSMIVRAFSLIDARTGKRALEKLKPPETEDKLVRDFYKLRMGATSSDEE